MESKFGRIKVSNNSPVIVIFSLMCVVAFFINSMTQGTANRALFSVYRAPLTDPFTYVRMFGHIFGHANWNHLISNLTLILVVGPLLEEKYGSRNMIIVIVVTALITGLVNYTFFPSVRLLGASGVAFAFVLLSPFTNMKQGYIPITFILVVVIYLGGQVYEGLFVRNNISNITHIIGGIIGAVLGYRMQKE